LLNITGASVARCCVVEEAALPARVNQHVAIIRPLEGTVLPNYLAYLLVSKTYKDLLLSVGEGGGATRQAITKAEIEQFKVNYPSSIDEQASIVHTFDILREQALQLKAIYNKQIKNFQTLKSAILAHELQSEAA
jgi:type I restriction enzyme S subunit